MRDFILGLLLLPALLFFVGLGVYSYFADAAPLWRWVKSKFKHNDSQD